MEYCEVKAVFANVIPELIRLRFDDGTTLGVTPDHEIWSNEQGWVQAETLVVGDTMLHESGLPKIVTEITTELERRLTYTLWIEGAHAFYANGVWVHNQVRRGVGSVLVRGDEV
jgi:intein/homing endonuclease